MHQNYHFLKHLAPELNKELAGKYFIEAFSQEKDELLLVFDNQPFEELLQDSFFIKASFRSDFSCLSFPEKFDRAKRNSVNLFTEFNGKQISAIRIFENERAFKMQFSDGSCMVFKLFGNRSNLIGYDSTETKIAIFNKRLIADSTLEIHSLDRKIDQTFDAYLAADGKHELLFPTFGKAVNSYIRNKISGMSSMHEKWAEIQNVILEMNSGQFYIANIDKVPVLLLLRNEQEADVFTNAIEALNQFYFRQVRLNGIDKEKAEVIRVLKKRMVQTNSYLENTFQKLVTLEGAIKNEELGHIIMANLNNIPARMEVVELFDFYRDQPIKIKLKKDLSPQKNAENYYRKSKNEKIEIDRLHESLNAREAELEQTQKHLDQLEIMENLRELRAYIKLHQILGGGGNKAIEAGDLFKKIIFQNYTILVGRNAKNNDVLTKQYAAKDDLWLHARDVSGSHVVIKYQAGKVFPQPVIERAAELAAYYSKRRTDSLCPVIVIPKKFVRKPKGAPDGAVFLDKETVVMVVPRDEF